MEKNLFDRMAQEGFERVVAVHAGSAGDFSAKLAMLDSHTASAAAGDGRPAQVCPHHPANLRR